MPLALGHDQEASACPWVRLTRRTAAYPSRVAQAALLLAGGAVSPSPDLVDQLYRCDDCGRCRAHSILPGPPDLPRALWQVRAGLVDGEGGIRGGRRSRRRSANTAPSTATCGPRSSASVRATPERASSSSRVRRRSSTMSGCGEGGASGGALRMLAASTSGSTRSTPAISRGSSGCAKRQRRSGSGCASSLARPATAWWLPEHRKRRSASAKRWLVLPVEVALRRERRCWLWPAAEETGGRRLARYDSVVFHPSETLLHRLDGFDEIDRWLAAWLGDAYRPEPDAKLAAWPAAIERPAIRVPAALTRALAERRMAQWRSCLQGRQRHCPASRLILTCDPFSLRALRDVAPPDVAVMDLLDFAFGQGRGGGAGG